MTSRTRKRFFTFSVFFWSKLCVLLNRYEGCLEGRRSYAQENDLCRRSAQKRDRIVTNVIENTVYEKRELIRRESRRYAFLFSSFCKRSVDVLLSLVIITVLAPVILAVAIGVKLSSTGPVFFIQYRTGYMGRRFRMYKFRTMVNDAEAQKEKLRHLSHHAVGSPDFKIANDPRITRIGAFLRKSSLDEVPNLVNVLLGEMSLVGPRPTSFDFETYEDDHLARLAVKPGITGLWQISGRSEVDFDERVALDLTYIENQSFLLDMKILLLTPLKVVVGKGAY